MAVTPGKLTATITTTTSWSELNTKWIMATMCACVPNILKRASANRFSSWIMALLYSTRLRSIRWLDANPYKCITTHQPKKKNSTKQRCAIQNRRTLFTCNSKSYLKHSITSFHIISKDFVRSTWLTESTWSHTCDSLARLFNSETKKREREKN